MRGYARKVDANHKAISSYFTRLGCMVHQTIGDWDLTVTRMGVVALIEIKDPASPNLKRRNRGDKLLDDGWPIRKVMTLADVMAVVTQMGKEARKREGME